MIMKMSKSSRNIYATVRYVLNESKGAIMLCGTEYKNPTPKGIAEVWESNSSKSVRAKDKLDHFIVSLSPEETKKVGNNRQEMMRILSELQTQLIDMKAMNLDADGRYIIVAHTEQERKNKKGKEDDNDAEHLLHFHILRLATGYEGRRLKTHRLGSKCVEAANIISDKLQLVNAKEKGKNFRSELRNSIYEWRIKHPEGTAEEYKKEQGEKYRMTSIERAFTYINRHTDIEEKIKNIKGKDRVDSVISQMEFNYGQAEKGKYSDELVRKFKDINYWIKWYQKRDKSINKEDIEKALTKEYKQDVENLLEFRNNERVKKIVSQINFTCGQAEQGKYNDEIVKGIREKKSWLSFYKDTDDSITEENVKAAIAEIPDLNERVNNILAKRAKDKKAMEKEEIRKEMRKYINQNISRRDFIDYGIWEYTGFYAKERRLSVTKELQNIWDQEAKIWKEKEDKVYNYIDEKTNEIENVDQSEIRKWDRFYFWKGQKETIAEKIEVEDVTDGMIESAYYRLLDKLKNIVAKMFKSDRSQTEQPKVGLQHSEQQKKQSETDNIKVPTKEEKPIVEQKKQPTKKICASDFEDDEPSRRRGRRR